MPIPRLNLLTPRKRWLLAIVVLVLLGLTLFDWDEWGIGKREEETVALAQVPAPVRAAIEQEAKPGTLKEIDKATVGGRTTYTASVIVNGKEQDVRIGEDGKVISRGAHEEEHDD